MIRAPVARRRKMSRIALSHKAAKLMKLCDLEGYKRLHDLLRASATDSVCPAISMTEGCDYTRWSAIKTPGTAKRAVATP
jgi:hypothetical protein